MTDPSPENIDWGELAEGYDWHINVLTEPGSPEFMHGLDVVEALRRRYHPHDVLVCPVSVDTDTLELTRLPGKVGVYVRRGAERTDQPS